MITSSVGLQDRARLKWKRRGRKTCRQFPTSVPESTHTMPRSELCLSCTDLPFLKTKPISCSEIQKNPICEGTVELITICPTKDWSREKAVETQTWTRSQHHCYGCFTAGRKNTRPHSDILYGQIWVHCIRVTGEWAKSFDFSVNFKIKLAGKSGKPEQ